MTVSAVEALAVAQSQVTVAVRRAAREHAAAVAAHRRTRNAANGGQPLCSVPLTPPLPGGVSVASSTPWLLFAGGLKGRKCSRTHKAPEPHRLSYAGCRTARLYRPNYCGVCRDGRCCSPRRTRTATVTFACADGERFDRAVMFIQSCKCSDECNHLNEAAMTPQRWLYGDTHKFLD
ncbi:unnamed protein product [Arctogadus glacialis]